MTHEEGIEAARKLILMRSSVGLSNQNTHDAIQAYLSASGMVLVRPGDPKMKNAAWDVMRAFYANKASKDASDEIVSRAIRSAANPFKSKP